MDHKLLSVESLRSRRQAQLVQDGLGLSVEGSGFGV